MRKLIFLLLLLLIATPVFAQQQEARMSLGVVGGKVAAAASCTTSNDGSLATSCWSGHNTFLTDTWLAIQITIAAQSTITEYIIRGCKNSDGNIKVSLYTNNAVPTPDQPNAEVAGSEVTVSVNAWDACDTLGDRTITLGAPLTGLASGLYWVVSQEDTAAIKLSVDETDCGGNVIAYSADGASWATYTNVGLMGTVFGCAE